MLIALTRGVSLRIAECELTFIDRQCIDYPRAVQQHSQYRQLLRNLGATVVELPSDDQCPDCCFLEDTALVLDEVAVITRPGSETRRREVDGVAPTIMKYRNVVRIDSLGTLEAGDVLRRAVISSSGSQPGPTSKGLRCYERHSNPTDTKCSRFP